MVAAAAPLARLRIQSNLYISEDRCRDLFTRTFFYRAQKFRPAGEL
jgi:hypothetical protein